MRQELDVKYPAGKFHNPLDFPHLAIGTHHPVARLDVAGLHLVVVPHAELRLVVETWQGACIGICGDVWMTIQSRAVKLYSRAVKLKSRAMKL